MTNKIGQVLVLILINNVSKWYKKHQALVNVSLQIPKGVCFGLVGPNGAGKSTLMKIIASIIHDFDGTYKSKIDKSKLGYVPQEIALEETLTGRDNLLFFGKLYGLSGQKLKTRVKEVLKKIGLEEREKDKVQTYSGGMKRRLNIGCAIMHNPELIIMDEPTVGVDPQSRNHIFQMIHQFKNEGKTIIYASHYMEEIERLCDMTAFIDDGCVIENDKLKNILNKHAEQSIFVKGMNCIPNDIEEVGILERKGEGFVIHTKSPIVALEKVINFTKEKSGELERLELVKPRLEDVFMTLTGSKLRD